MDIGNYTIRQVQMSSKGTICLTDTGKVLLAGELSQKSGEGFEVIGDLCLEQISSHSTGRHWLGLDKFGKIWAAGDNSEGQCGRNVSQNRIDKPVKVENLPEMCAISAGFDYSLAASRTGKVFGWGNSTGARLTSNCTGVRSVEPVPIIIDDYITQISAGSQRAVSFALSLSGTVYCWGDGSCEKLGEIRKSDHVIQETPMKMANFECRISKIVSGAGFCAALSDEG